MLVKLNSGRRAQVVPTQLLAPGSVLTRAAEVQAHCRLSVMFAVYDVHDTVARLRAHGAELLGEVAQFRASSCSATFAAPRASSLLRPNRSAEASWC